MKSSDFTAAELRKAFAYNAKTGEVTRRSTGLPAAFPKRAKGGIRFMAVSLRSCGIQATRVIYAIENRRLPAGLRTEYVDGDRTNLRRSNLKFFVDAVDTAAEPRMIAKIIQVMEKQGGKSSTPKIRAALGINYKTPVSAYMRLLQASGRAHICGVDKSGPRNALLWALGPGGDAPQEAKAIQAEMRKRRGLADVEPDYDGIDAAAARRRAQQSVVAARSGLIANSIFSVAAQLN